jgi:hypothetical protein
MVWWRELQLHVMRRRVLQWRLVHVGGVFRGFHAL